MDFFKSVFSDDPDPHSPQPEAESSETNNSQEDDNPQPNPPPNPQPISAAGGWSFGGFIKTLSVKSESVIETYRRDLQEFGTGLKKELEVAQGSIGTVSSAIDEFGNSVLKGTAQIISHGKDAILAVDHESDSSDNNYNSLNSSGQQKPYSRFDAQVRAIQGDVSTYCEEVDDLDDYKKWKSGFVLDNVREEIESLFEENGAVESLYKRVVPNSVDHETFWSRYFYRVFKLKQAENLRASLVKRAISREEEEELSWDVDDDDDDDGEGWSPGNLMTKKDAKEIEDVGRKNLGKTVGEEANVSAKSDLPANKELGEEVTEKTVDKELELGDKVTENSVNKELELGDKVTEKTVKEDSLKVDGEGEKISKSDTDEVSKGSVAKSCSEDVVNDKMDIEKNGGVKKEDSGLKSDDKVVSMDKGETGESSKDSDLSIVSSQPSMPEEEDLGWDEIEDLSSIDEKKVTHARSPNRADLRKRLSVTEEEEDLSWDIEDDDEPVKA